MSTRFQPWGQSAPSEYEIPLSAQGLRADRTDISFENITPELVRIDVHVTNDGDFWSPASTVSLQSAPLGVFLEWHPLFSLSVPALAPHTSATVSGTAWAPQPQPKKLTCADLWTMPPHLLQEFVETAAREEREEAEREARRQVRRPAPILAGDPMAVLGRSGTYWAGNIDILMRGKAAERHMARALRIYPGKTNAAMFFVGDRLDGYKFELSGDVEDWKAEVSGQGDGSPRKGKTMPVGEFREFTRGTFYLLMRPPADAQKGFIAVHVTRQSDGMQAQVEFNLDSRSAGAGCYKL